MYMRVRSTFAAILASGLLVLNSCGPSATDQGQIDRMGSYDHSESAEQAKARFDIEAQQILIAAKSGDVEGTGDALFEVVMLGEVAVEQSIAIIQGERAILMHEHPRTQTTNRREDDLVVATMVLKTIPEQADAAIPALESIASDSAWSDRLRNHVNATLQVISQATSGSE